MEDLREKLPQLRADQATLICRSLQTEDSAEKVHSVLQFLVLESLVRPNSIVNVLNLLAHALTIRPISEDERRIYARLEDLLPQGELFGAGARCLFDLVMGKWPPASLEVGPLGKPCFEALAAEAVRRNEPEQLARASFLPLMSTPLDSGHVHGQQAGLLPARQQTLVRLAAGTT